MPDDMLHGIELSSDQLAQLRAINHEYYTACSRCRAREVRGMGQGRWRAQRRRPR